MDDDNLLWRLEYEGRFWHMKPMHYVGMVVLLAIGYYIGTTYPRFWTKVTGA